MIRTSGIALAALYLIGCAGDAPPTSGECRALLQSRTATRTEMVAFIVRVKRDLDAAPRNRIDSHTEGLGLCTGALMRKAQSIK